MTYFFETFGCQMNHAESASVAQILIERGWSESSADSADLVILNTCSVRITAETRAMSRIYHYCAQKKKHPVIVLVMGCMAERLVSDLKKKYKKLDYVVGMFERQLFTDIFSCIEQGIKWTPIDEKPSNAYWFAPSSWEKGSFQSNVPIMNGCNNFCTYCIVPYVRGREVSRSFEDIMAEIDGLAARGVREITLLGQNVNSWRYIDRVNGSELAFPDLLERIARKVEQTGSIRWIRFMSSHPKDLSDALIDVIAREPVFCRYIHLPVQHGSTRILDRMNRKYTRESYLDLVARIRSKIPGVGLSTDIMVGFPGETDEDIEQTLELQRHVGFDTAFMYYYNPREGTAACDFPDQIPEDIKKQRLDRVIKLQHSISSALMKNRVGKTVAVLIESTSRNNPDELFGHTECGEMVVFDESLDHSHIGNCVEAQLTCLRGRTFRAKIISSLP